MADIVTEEAVLKIDNYFVDGDTRVITLKNPLGNITTEQVQELETFMRTNNIIQGDKMQGTFGKISSVTRVTTRKRYLDFTS